MSTFVLIHGAFQTGDSWSKVRAELERLGHQVHNPTAAGLREGDSTDVDTDQSCDPLVEFIVENDLQDVILVGHSWGGVLISKIAERVPDRIRRMVFHNAFVVQDGEAVLDNLPPFFPPALQADAEARGDGTVMLPFEVWRDGFMNDATYELAHQVYSELKPHPLLTFTEALDLSKFYELQIPRSYVFADEDNALHQGEWCWHPRMSSRLGVFRLVKMPGGHEVMHTAPQMLAQKIVEAGRD